MINSTLKGTITAIVTPFKKNLSVDYEKFKSLIDFQIQNGVEGIVVCGSTGENATLNPKERLALIITAVEHSAERVPIIAGTGSNNTAETIDITLLAKEHGANAALIVAPYYNKPTQEGLYNHYHAVASEVNIPIMLYNVPSRTSVNIHAEIQLKLAEDHKNIFATKEASGDLEQISQIIKYAPENFVVFAGDDSLALPVISIGGVGVVSVLSNYAPKKMSDLVRLALAGEISEARKLHYELLDLMAINFVESNPIPVKAALALMGKIGNYLRLPLMPITPQNRNRISNALKHAGLL
jgi:4-hydroxy-tetrahydrodipicolinate synthase